MSLFMPFSICAIYCTLSSHPVRFKPFRASPYAGQKAQIYRKNTRNHKISGVFCCQADSNCRLHPYQRKIFHFSNLFALFIGISAPSALLSGTFEVKDFRLFRLRLWLFVWSKAFGHLNSGSTHKDIRTKGTPVTYPSVTTIELLFPLLFYPQQF